MLDKFEVDTAPKFLKVSGVSRYEEEESKAPAFPRSCL